MTPRALFHPARLARRPVLSTQSDERLVDLVRAGSDPAFETIVARYRQALMRYVSRLLPPERAEDVVQLAFVNAYRAMHRGNAELRLRPWLYRIAHNTALNALRDGALAHAPLDDRLDGVERPDQAIERAQGLRELVVAVQALPERQRAAIVLRELEGRSYEEIAAQLGVTDGAVRQLLNRARNTLRAAAAAVLPAPLLTRLAAAEPVEPAAGRVAELVGVGTAGGTAVAAKLCASVLVTGAVVGGVALAPEGARNSERGPAVGAERAEASTGGRPRGDAGSAAATDPGPAAPGREPRGDGRDDGKGADADERGSREADGDESGRDDDRDDRGGAREHVVDVEDRDDDSGRGEAEDPGDDRLEAEDDLDEAHKAETDDDAAAPGGGRSGSSRSGSDDDELAEPAEESEDDEPDSSGSGSGKG